MTAGLYLWGVLRLHRRGDRWPVGRTLSFVVVGMGSATLATVSGLAVYDDTLLSVHMVQHMILAMVVPLAMALGAPITLALRTLPRRPRRWLLVVLHSRVAKVLTFPPLTFTLFVLTPVGALLLRLVPRHAAQRLPARDDPLPHGAHRLPVLLAAGRASTRSPVGSATRPGCC